MTSSCLAGDIKHGRAQVSLVSLPFCMSQGPSCGVQQPLLLEHVRAVSPQSLLGRWSPGWEVVPAPSPPTSGSTEGPTLPLYYNLFHIKIPPAASPHSDCPHRPRLYLHNLLEEGGHWSGASFQMNPEHLCKEIQRPFTRLLSLLILAP